MVNPRQWLRCIICLCASVILFIGNAKGEFYVAGQLGQQLSNSFGEITTTGGPRGVRFTDLDLDNSLLFGAKAGYFFPQVPNLGLELEAFHAKPDLKAQSSIVTGPVPGVFEFDQTNFRVMTVAFNVVARAQADGFEPYAGIGLGLFFARLRDQTGASISDNGVPGLNAFAGYRSFLGQNLALFVEYKYDRARFTFKEAFDPAIGIGTGLRGDYEAHQMMFGLSYHFH